MLAIDISIVTFNSEKWLLSFFESLKNINYDLKLLNILIQDNSSTDNTWQLLLSLQSQFHQDFAGITVAQGPNLGFGYGHNQNFKKSQATLFLVTNVDLIFEKDTFNFLLQEVLRDREKIYASFELRQKPYEHPKYYDPITLETRWSSSACILFRHHAFEKIGGYEERIFLYGEDVEISYRLRDNGYKLKYCPRAVCWHYSYAHENEVKPLQFFGSKLANVYIRLRYGNIFNIIIGYMMFLALFLLPIKIPHYRKQLFENMKLLLKNTVYYLKTRKKSAIKFRFRQWDYDFRRRGAFYNCPKIDDQTQPLVSVIIRTTAERKLWLRQAISSVLNQTYPNIELVVIEDGSNFAVDYINQLQQEMSLTQISYQAISKSGRCVAGNVGLELAHGEYIVFLDDDDLLFADHLEILANALQKNKQYNGVYSASWSMPTAVQSLDPLRYTITSPKNIFQPTFSRKLLLAHNYLPIQSVLFKKECYRKNGGFDLSLQALEDWDLWIRYTVDGEFMAVDKTTSLFRVPLEIKKSYQRAKTLDKFYNDIMNKHGDINGYHPSLKDRLRRIVKKSVLSFYPFYLFYYYIAKILIR